MQINIAIQLYKKNIGWDFAGGPTVNTLPSSAGGGGSIPGPEAKIPLPLGQKNKAKNKSNGVTNSIKTLKMICIKKTFIEKKEYQEGWVCVYMHWRWGSIKSKF